VTIRYLENHLNFIVRLRKVPQVQKDAKGHVENSQNDGQFHFVRIKIDDLVVGDDPDGILK